MILKHINNLGIRIIRLAKAKPAWMKKKICNNHLKKVIYWRILSTFIASLITWRYLGKLDKSIGLVVILTLVMTTLHYYFEKFWKNYEDHTNDFYRTIQQQQEKDV
jgi:uncharacterized membrane protein